MSKSIGKVFGTGSTNAYGYENNYLNYLRNYDTSNYDNTLGNMTSTALNMSNGLGNMPDYQFSATASDEARQRAENATYNAYLDKLQPQFAQQTADLQSNLINQGITVGSEAYQRAMTDLQNNQNNALQQAAYQSVINGQNAYSNALNDSMQTVKFNNDMRQNYIDQIQSLLNGSTSGYTNQSNIYALQSGTQNRINTATKEGLQNFMDFSGGFARSIIGGK